jgi:hypothetical protein
MKYVPRSVCALALSLGVLLAATPAFGQSKGGTVNVFVLPSITSNGGGGKIVLTGAIGDYGTTKNVKHANNIGKVTLKKGTFEVDLKAINTAGNNAQPTNFNSTTCSASVSVPPTTVTIVSGSGTGAYSGITGSFSLSEQFAFIGPRNKDGSCNMSNSAQPVGGVAIVTGSGTVAY